MGRRNVWRTEASAVRDEAETRDGEDEVTWARVDEGLFLHWMNEFTVSWYLLIVI